MYSQYKNLAKAKSSQSQLQKFFQDADADEVVEMIQKVLSSSEIVKILDDIFKSYSVSEKFADKRHKIVKKIFTIIKQSKLSNKHVENIVNRIIVDFPLYEKIHLVKLVDFFLSSIRDNDDEYMSWKDVLPVLFENLQEEKTINYKGTCISGYDYKISIIRSICDIEWSPKILTPLTKMFCELIIGLKEKSVYELILKALIAKLEDTDLNELPPFVHQLLKLSAEQNNTILFSSLSKYFNKHYNILNESSEDCDSTEKFTLKELQEVESTVLYHIYQSAHDNQKSLLEYMKNLKMVLHAPEFVLEPFVMSVLLMISEIYEEQALQILKLAIIRQIQEEEHQNNSAWLRKVSPKATDFMDTIDTVISNSNKDRQLVFKGLVDLAFVLLSIECKTQTEVHLPWEYGKRILQKVARKHRDAGATILENLIDKIVRGGANITQYTDCLGFMCKKQTMIVLDHQAWISTLLEQLLDIPGNAAMQVLTAVLPLMRVSAPIRDNLVMVLRKAVYRKGTQSREMAILGFLQLLKNLKLSSLTSLSQSESLSSSNVASSSSILTQATLEGPSQRQNSNPWHNTSLCREILAILSKCFTHEAEVRSRLYFELYQGVYKNLELAEYIIDMLMENFMKYYVNDEEIILPINFEKCTSVQGIDVLIQEPLGELIFILQKIYVKVASKDSLIIDKLAVILESLCKRMAKVEIEHLNLDENADLSDTAPKTQQKLLNVKLTISILEALIGYKIASWSVDSANNGRLIVSLHKTYNKFVEYLKKSHKPKKGEGKKKDKDAGDESVKKSGRMGSIKLLNSVIDFDVVSKCLMLLYKEDNGWTTPDQISPLRDRVEFHQYIFQTCLQLFHNVKTMKDYELKSITELNRSNFFSIANTLFEHFLTNLEVLIDFNEQTAILGIECFKECSELITTVYASELPNFLKLICEADPREKLPIQIQKLNSTVEEHIKFCLNFEDNENEKTINPKISLNLIEIYTTYFNKIIFDEYKAEDVFSWVSEIAEKKSDIDIAVTSLILNLLLQIDEKSLEYGETLQDVCIEFCTELGTIDKKEITSSKKYCIINERTVSEAYLLVNKILSIKMQNINWFLGRLNSEHAASTLSISDEDTGKNSVKEKEQSLCRQFANVISTFEVLANVNIVPGPTSDAIMKNLQKVYLFASSLTKYFSKKSTQTNPAFQSVKFIPVIQGAGSALRQAIHELILHIERNQELGKSNDSNVRRNKILKEVMTIPATVKAMDIFEKDILLLQKKTGVELLKYTKSNAIRDFRITRTTVLESIEKMNVTLNPNTQLTNKTRVEDTNTQQNNRPRTENTSTQQSNRSRTESVSTQQSSRSSRTGYLNSQRSKRSGGRDSDNETTEDEPTPTKKSRK